MKKMVFTLLAVGTVGVAVPAIALARGDGHHRHHRARVRHTRVHQARVRHERFGRSDSSAASRPPDNAGTVAAFTGGVLTIKLTGGSTVSGRVTDATEIECRTPESSAMQTELRRDGEGDRSGDNDAASNEDNGDRDEAAEDDGHRDSGEGAQRCGALASGMTVREAELTVSNTGAIWHKVELLTQP